MGKRVEGKPKKKSIKTKAANLSSKRKLAKMGKKQKKGHSGTVVRYMTRSQALRKLQITLKDFRYDLRPSLPQKSIFFSSIDVCASWRVSTLAIPRRREVATAPVTTTSKIFPTWPTNPCWMSSVNSRPSWRRYAALTHAHCPGPQLLRKRWDQRGQKKVREHSRNELGSHRQGEIPHFHCMLYPPSVMVLGCHSWFGRPSVYDPPVRSSPCWASDPHKGHLELHPSVQGVADVGQQEPISSKGVRIHQGYVLSGWDSWREGHLVWVVVRVWCCRVVPHQFSQSLPQNVDYRIMLTFLEFYQVCFTIRVDS